MRLPLTLLLAVSTLWAQGPERPRVNRPLRPGGPGPGEEGPLAPQLMQIRMTRIRESLNLPEERARAISQRWGEYDREFMQNNRQIQQVRQRFGEILFGPGSEEEKNVRVKPLLEQFLDLRRRQVEAKSRFEEDILAQLSPAQQARLIMLVDNLTQRLLEAVRNRPGPGRRFQGGPE
ncbi:MAG: hypothetical protein HY823_01665 [Acidobacteria bacterium]|nr:hypothetical protein [Acidobacteriota bacterium]